MPSDPITVDLYSPEHIADPYPAYARLRAESPVLRLRDPDVWVLSRYEDVHAALRAPETFSSASGIAFGGQGGDGSLVATDAPDHIRLRRILSRQFTPRSVTALEKRISTITADLLDGVADLDSFDFMERLGAALPTRVIAEYLGIDPERWPDYKRWSDAFGAASWSREPDAWSSPDVQQAVGEAIGLFAAEIARRRTETSDDLIGRLVTAADEGLLSDDESINFCSLLLLAGNVTTSSALAHSVLTLLAHPEQREALRADPSLVPQAVEEIVRFESPVQGFVRTLTEDVELHGSRLRAGEEVFLLFASANRDEAAFEDAGVFDVTRSRGATVAFGAGPHFCLGAWLARIELRIAIEAILPLLERWEQAPGDPVTRVPNPAFRDVASLRLVRKGIDRAGR